jgi:DNA-binding XRE family transcriptional regulator
MKLDIMKIVRMLAELGMTKSELASKSGVSRQQISTIIGRGTCCPKTAGKLAAGLGIPVGEIMKEVV